MKRKNPIIQGPYGEIFQPDVMPQWQLWGGCIVLIAALIPLIIWSIQGDDPILPGVTALLAVIFVLFEGKNVMVNRRNRALAFGVTPWQLTILWNGQPVREISWENAIELFSVCGPCEIRYSGGFQSLTMSYGVYVSLQYGFESRIDKAKRQILNLHISQDSIDHLERFPVLRIYEDTDDNRCQQLLRRLESYRSEALAKRYEEKET